MFAPSVHTISCLVTIVIAMFQAQVATCSRTSSHPSDTTDLARVMLRWSESVACNHNRMHVALSHAD
jgi:hypothetical protein